MPQFEFLQESDASLGVKVGPGYWNDLPYLANSGVKIYRATLSQSGGSAPVATVLENTLGGEVVWTRTTAGAYSATLADAFPDPTKVLTQATYGANTDDYTVDGVIVGMNYLSADVIQLLSYSVDGVAADMKVDNAAVEILVYP